MVQGLTEQVAGNQRALFKSAIVNEKVKIMDFVLHIIDFVLKIMDFVLKIMDFVFNEKDQEGRSPLHYAA